MSNPNYGYLDGDVCGRNGCEGVIELESPENCSCHITAPCSACTSTRMFCPLCYWRDDEEDPIEADPQPELSSTEWFQKVMRGENPE